MRFLVLGELAVRGMDDEAIEVAGAKERQILAMLAAAAPAVVSVDRLVEQLWDGRPPLTATKSLQAHLVRLRSALEPDRPRGSSGRYVVRRGTGYALAVDRDAIDSLAAADLTARGRALLSAGDPDAALSQLSAAVGMWRGEPYADWPEAAFADVERRRLAEVRTSAVTGLLEAQLALGRHAEAIPELERLVAEEPLREGWWRLLMLALYRESRQADALAAGRRLRALLAEELGADPTPALQRLERAILEQDSSLDLARPTAPSLLPEPRAAGTCPYLGLAAYQAEDAPLFRGRQRLVSDLVSRLVDTRLLVVSGPSGAGKSSVVRAGLVPALAAGGLPGSSAWPAVIVTPGTNAVDALSELTGLPGPARPVLLVCDQFEELWAPGTEPPERVAFLDTVLGLLDDGVVARCVVVVRGDHVGRMAEHAAFAERLAGAVVLVPPLTDPELRDVVTEPARRAGLSVESELLDVAVGDVVGRVGALPLFSTALVGTWERRRGDVLTLAGYLQAGGVAGALTRSAELAYGSLDEEGQQHARRILVRLADSEGSGALVRRRVPLAELDLDGEGGAARRDVVETFVNRRLLAIDEDRLEVAHEALLTQWPRLARWLDDDAIGRSVRRHLAPAALEWDRGGRPADELYRGARLGAALDWSAQPDADLTPVEREFLETSRGHAESELRAAQERAEREAAGRRRTRRLAAGLAGVLVVALAATGLAVNYQRDAAARALESEAHRLANLSTTVNSLDLSLLLAAQANRLADTPETQDGLLSALVQHRRAARVVRFKGTPQDSELGGGNNLFFLIDDGLVTWNVGGTASPRTIPVPETWDGWRGSDGSPTDATLAGSGMANEEIPWIATLGADGVERFRMEGPKIGGLPMDVSYRSDGRRLLVLVGTADPAGSAHGWRWQVKEVDLASRQIRPLRAAGTFRGTEELRASVSDDDSSVVLWTPEGGGAASWVDVRTGRQTPLRVSPRNAATRQILPLSGSLAAQLWEDGALALYDRTGRRLQLIDDAREGLRRVLMSPDGTWGATAGTRGGVDIWAVDPDSGRWTPQESLRGHDGEVICLEVDPTGRLLLSVSADGTVISWDMSPDAGFGSAVPGLSGWWISNRPELTPDGRLLVAPTRALSRRRGYTPSTDPDSIPLAVAATFLDPLTGRVVDRVAVGDTLKLVGLGSSVAVSPDGTKVAVTSGLRTTVLDTTTREKLGSVVLPAPPGNVDDAGDALPSEVVWCSVWSPDGSRLLIGANGQYPSGDGGGIVVVDTANWQPERRVTIGAPQYIEYSPDKRWIAVGRENASEVKILDATSYDVRHTLSLATNDSGPDVSFSPDGTRLAAGGARGQLSVWDTTTWKSLYEPLKVHSARVMQVEWIDDRTVASSGSDGTVTMVDVIRGRIRAEPLPGSSVPGPGYTHLIPATPGELVTLSGERPGHRYPLNPAQWLAEVCTVVGRDLTREEWARYIPGLEHRKTCTDL